jgi:hypothetical protein
VSSFDFLLKPSDARATKEDHGFFLTNEAIAEMHIEDIVLGSLSLKSNDYLINACIADAKLSDAGIEHLARLKAKFPYIKILKKAYGKTIDYS